MKKDTPGCSVHDCCESGCELFADDFDRADSTDLGDSYREDSGDWEISSNQLVAGFSAAAVAIVSDTIDDPSLIVQVDWLQIPGTTARVCVGYVDPSNYLAMVVEGAGDLLLVRRSGGSDSTLEHVSFPFGFASLTLRLCFNGTHARATILDVDRLPVAEAEADVTLSDVGVGLVANGGALFNNLTVYRNRTDSIPHCRECAEAEYCCPGEIPTDRNAFVDLTSVALSSNGHCGSACSDLANLFELLRAGDCGWHYEDEQFCEMEVGDRCAEGSTHEIGCGFNDGEGPDGDYFWKLTIDVGFAPCLMYVEILITGECASTDTSFTTEAKGCSLFARYEAEFDPPDDPSAEAAVDTYTVNLVSENWQDHDLDGLWRLCNGSLPASIQVTV